MKKSTENLETKSQPSWSQICTFFSNFQKEHEKGIVSQHNREKALYDQMEAIKQSREQDCKHLLQKLADATRFKASSSISLPTSQNQNTSIEMLTNQKENLTTFTGDTDYAEIEQLKEENNKLKRAIQTSLIVSNNEQQKYRDLEQKYTKIQQEFDIASTRKKFEESSNEVIKPVLGRRRLLTRNAMAETKSQDVKPHVELGKRERVQDKSE
ncbi:hypothetical protein HK096_011136 [Nowakowskiella sp. JEL0078]|nr:hypothetical protein HK096_011136 [Nowakowskiella sp. JEL0078]